MPNNQEALDAIVDIKEAIAEYGSSIKIATESETGYDPYSGATYTTTYTDTKGLVGRTASSDLQIKIRSDLIGSYEMSIVLYIDSEITKDNNIVFKEEEYDIKYIDKKFLQDTLIKYELLVAKS